MVLQRYSNNIIIIFLTFLILGQRAIVCYLDCKMIPFFVAFMDLD